MSIGNAELLNFQSDYFFLLCEINRLNATLNKILKRITLLISKLALPDCKISAT